MYLPVFGLLIFALGTFNSVRFNRMRGGNTGKYFYWSSIRLDSDPANRQGVHSADCGTQSTDEPFWEPQSVWVEPGLLARTLIISACPAFLVGGLIVRGFARIGVSEVATFMILMPPLIFAWYYFVSWVALRVIKRKMFKRGANH
jgi:hypothetical protein